MDENVNVLVNLMEKVSVAVTELKANKEKIESLGEGIKQLENKTDRIEKRISKGLSGVIVGIFVIIGKTFGLEYAKRVIEMSKTMIINLIK